MEKELGADVIKTTQASLGKYVKRPPLSEKLLKKPPFRFLHDIISTVHKTTGFFEGLFDEDELISENVKDRDSKILFLNKVITVIGTTTGKSLSVKSSKIVAGQEPDKTNELLQYLAFALDKKLSSDDAVKKYKETVKAPVSTEIKTKEKDTTKTKEKDATKLVKKSIDTKKLSSKSSEKLTTSKKELGTVNKIDNNTNNESKTNKKENNVVKNEIQPKKSKIQKNKNTLTNPEPLADLKSNKNINELEEEDKHKDEINIEEEAEQLNVTSKAETPKETTATDMIIQSTDQESNGKIKSSYTIGENELNSSLSSQDLMEVENSDKSTRSVIENNSDNNGYQDQPNHINKDTLSTHGSKALPIKNTESILTKNESIDSVDTFNEIEKWKTTDKIVSNSSSRKNSDVIRPPSVRPSSSRPGAPRLREKIDNIITDNENLLLAKVNIIAENTNNEEEEDTSVIIVEQHTSDESTIDNNQDQLHSLSNEHGHLVQQILDSQKEFSQIGKTEIEWQFGAQKVNEAVTQEIEQLRFNIQALSRVANPLGKLLDHIQEDAEVMRQELQQWTNAYEEVSKEMQKQKTANEETLVPLQTRVKQLDVDIKEKRDKIDDLKILIHKNVSRIEKLLMNGDVQ